jgi:hypothetical protein
MVYAKCDQCETEYSSDEYTALDETLAVKDDTIPNPQHGYHKVCKCGAEFWVDRYQRTDTVEHDGDEYHVSTVFLTIPHGPNHDQWYETLAHNSVVRRYETEEEADAGHEEICEKIRSGDFSARKIETGIEIQ